MMDNGFVSTKEDGKYLELTADDFVFISELLKLEKKGFVPIWETFKTYLYGEEDKRSYIILIKKPRR